MSEHFKDRIILEGGMLLRLLNSPRATQDVDYLLVSESSKKILASEIKNILLKLEDIVVKDVKLNSRGIFIGLEGKNQPDINAFLEINVVSALLKPPASMSTVALARRYSMTGRVIASMDMSEAFSHKIAAALQRDSIRDLYDMTIFEPLCTIDMAVLRKRLSNLSIKRQKAKNISLSAAAEMLKARADGITQDKVKKELGAWLPMESLQGMDLIIKSTILRMAQKIGSGT
jgi:predicted nucleotidyltransferase component of viral defense system